MSGFILQEVAPHTLLLQNRTIQGEANLVYRAAFEARDAVIIGKQVFQETENWREPIGSFIVAVMANFFLEISKEISNTYKLA